MADPLPPERIAELRRIIDGFKRGVEMGWRATRIAFANELADFAERHAEALLAAAEENAKLRAEVERLRTELAGLRSVIVEATMDPFDLGPCYVAGPLQLKKKHEGEMLAVDEHRLEGVFEQLLARVEAKVPGTIAACNREREENAKLRAQRDALVAAGDCVAAACFDTAQHKVVSDRLLQQIRDLQDTIRTIRAARDEKPLVHLASNMHPTFAHCGVDFTPSVKRTQNEAAVTCKECLRVAAMGDAAARDEKENTDG